MIKGVIAEGSYRRLMLVIFCIFLLFSILSALLLHNGLNAPLGPHYGAALSNVIKIKESLITKTIQINLILYLLTALGVTLLGVFYSHRIAGPLFKVKLYAKELREGRFDKRIKFRKRDVIHKLADLLNKMAERYQAKVGLIAIDLTKLEEDLQKMSSVPDKSAEQAVLIKRLLELDSKIKEELIE